MSTLKKISALAIALIILSISAPATAHFGMVIPSDSMVMQQDARTLRVTFSFSHPMENIGMELAKPKTAIVFAAGRRTDLVPQLNPVKVMGHSAWALDYKVKRPGIHIFYMEPQPYWEPAEDAYIIHHTKTIVTAFGDDEGWDTELGVKTEIVPLARPFGLYAGNLFQGMVKLDGKPVPHSTVEVEFYNQDAKTKTPNDIMFTQTIKADGNGVFSYAVPAAGWWGFAALNPSDQKIRFKGKEKAVELGAVVWVKFHSWGE